MLLSTKKVFFTHFFVFFHFLRCKSPAKIKKNVFSDILIYEFGPFFKKNFFFTDFGKKKTDLAKLIWGFFVNWPNFHNIYTSRKQVLFSKKVNQNDFLHTIRSYHRCQINTFLMTQIEQVFSLDPLFLQLKLTLFWLKKILFS